MSRALVIDTGTGAIQRVLVGEPTMMADQIGAGQSLWVMGAGDNGTKVNDRWLVVNGAGELEILPGAPAGVGVPAGALEFVMSVA
jgi:hypothetical protein